MACDFSRVTLESVLAQLPFPLCIISIVGPTSAFVSLLTYNINSQALEMYHVVPVSRLKWHPLTEETGETLDTWEEEHTILCQFSTPDSHLL